jgi:hypothetical protein
MMSSVNKALRYSFFSLLPLLVNGQFLWNAEVSQEGFLSGNNNSFWSTSNNLGIVRPETLSLTSLNATYQRYLGELSDLKIGASAFYDYGGKDGSRIGVNEAFVSVAWWVIETSLGPRARAEMHQGLSAVNGDILWSNNSRPPPGVEIRTRNPMKPWRWIGMEGALAHYWLGKERYVQNSFIHHKYLGLYFSPTESSVFKARLHHYAQWGGTSPETGTQPTSFKDLVLVFFGQTNSSTGDSTGALGNHIGSYHLLYQYFMPSGHLEWYYQAMFEGSAGKESGNYPDGLYGFYWDSGESSLLRGLLVEYIQTSWQGGVAINDNYFNHGTYRSGWTYQNNGLGIPFFTFNKDLPGFTNNRISAFHLGARAVINESDYLLRASYVKNMGLRDLPYNPTENTIYTQLQMNRPIGDRLTFGVAVGADFSNLNDSNFTIGVALRYKYEEAFRW